MTIKNFDAILTTRAGEEIKTENDVPLTAKTVILACLDGRPGNTIQGEEKHKRFKLGERVYKGGDEDYIAEELALIKRVVGESEFYPLVVGQIYDIIDS